MSIFFHWRSGDDYQVMVSRFDNMAGIPLGYITHDGELFVPNEDPLPPDSHKRLSTADLAAIYAKAKIIRRSHWERL